jgi:ribosome-associated protein
MAVKRAKSSRPNGASRAAAPSARQATKDKVTKLSTARKKLASKGPTPAKKKAAAKSIVKSTAAPKAATKQPVVNVVEGALDEMKAVNVKVLAVKKLTDITDTMIIASGNSDRHVRSIADRVVEHAKKAGFRPMGVEGERDGEWVLVDLQDVIVHIMLPKVREFYRLESLWDVSAARREATEQSA